MTIAIRKPDGLKNGTTSLDHFMDKRKNSFIYKGLGYLGCCFKSHDIETGLFVHFSDHGLNTVLFHF
jgi:hypothetical protein